MAFERAMRMIRGDREIQLLHLGRAHTEGDVFVYLPREKVVITGDAVIGWTPFMGDGYPQDWVGTLDRLADLDFEYMIMGHGGTAGKDWLKLFRSYIGDLVAAVRREAEAGATLAETQARVIEILAPVYEGPLTAYAGDYRPWRTLALGNVERTYAMVS
jgi:glyoxylase-like metal-dependent hydrolase (beta-lactamase superfamily II)